MLEEKELLAFPRISSEHLFALKRLPEALDGDLLTSKEARRGAAYVAPQFAPYALKADGQLLCAALGRQPVTKAA